MNSIDIIDRIWTSSRFFGNSLANILKISDSYPLEATSMLFTILESIARSSIDNYEAKTIDVYNQIYKDGFLSKEELDFLNDNKFSIRIIRNKLLHKNISKYNFVVTENNKEILYPFSEESTWKLYIHTYSKPILSLCYNLLCSDLIVFSRLNIFDDFTSNFQDIKTLTPKEIMLLKGYKTNDIETIFKNYTSDSEKYIVAENASDLNILCNIFKNIPK